MEVEFDPVKEEANRLKHGISLNQAKGLDWQRLIVRVDARRDYGEVREIGLAPICHRLHCVVFVRLTDEACRVISLRKANPREQRAYEKAQAD
jgi:uncharacterized protein